MIEENYLKIISFEVLANEKFGFKQIFAKSKSKKRN